MQAKSIAQVIKQLDEIVDWSIEHNSRAGYFAALYRKVTIKIQEGIKQDLFEDNARMERFDVIFANRFLRAHALWQAGKNPTMVWQTTFHALKSWQPLVLQHLLLGMNAHINLDLGIAAARTAPGSKLASLENDFNKINDVLAELVNSVVDELCQIWPPLRLLTVGKADNVLANFSMDKARAESWAFAETLAALKVADQEDEIRDKDYQMAKLGMVFANPGAMLNLALLPVRVGERGSIVQKIHVLSQPTTEMKSMELNLYSDFNVWPLI